MSRNLICYQFSRSKVERGDFTHFLGQFGPARLPKGPRLLKLMDSFVFAIDGYNDDPREINTIPEVRTFYRSFHDAWPYWLFFCNLDQDGLKTMILSCLESITAIKVDGSSNCVVRYDPMELIRFIGGDFAPMNLMCERAGMTDRGIYERTKQVMEYFEFPFDVALPD